MLNKLLLIAFCLFTLGNISSLSRLGGYNLYLYDIYLSFFNIGVFIWYIKRKQLLIPINYLFAITFLIFSLLSTLFSISNYPFSDQFLVLSYLIRFGNYSFLGFLIYVLIKSKILLINDFQNILKFNFYFLLALNIAQYFLFRDISSLSIYGFDPHQNRLTGTFLDPNYMGIYLIIYFLFSELTLNSRIVSVSSFIMILLTESRSAFLTLLLALIILLIRSPKYLLYIILLFVFSFGTSFINRIELSKAANDSSNLRIESWKNAIQLYSLSPEFGIGFNNYRNMSKFYNLTAPENYYSNSSNSSDSSLLSILVMTGGIGLFLFLLYFISFGISVYDNLIYLAVIFFNSIFINSLFFPAICVLILVILNYNLARKV